MFRHVSSFCILILSVLLSLPLAAQETTLNYVSNPARGPKILVTKDNTVAVVWQGWLEGQNRIFMRLRNNGEWGPERIVDSGLPGDHLLPQIAIEGNTIHLAWINRSGRTDSVCYGLLENNQWLYSDPYAFDPGVLCDSLSVAAGIDSSAYIAYQIRHAGGSTIGFLNAAADDRISEIELDAASENAFSLYPQVFQNAPVEALWYQAEGDRFQLRAAEADASGQWREQPAGDLLQSLNVRRLPMLFEGPRGDLIGLWFDSLDGRDRVLLSREENAEPQVIDSRPDWNNSIPAGAISDSGKVGVAWVGETQNGSAIFVKEIGDAQLFRLPCDSSVCTYPQVAYSREGHLLAVWQSDVNFSGAGDIYFHEIAP